MDTDIVYDIEFRTHTIITSGQLVEVQLPKFVETASIDIVNMSED